MHLTNWFWPLPNGKLFRKSDLAIKRIDISELNDFRFFWFLCFLVSRLIFGSLNFEGRQASFK